MLTLHKGANLRAGIIPIGATETLLLIAHRDQNQLRDHTLALSLFPGIRDKEDILYPDCMSSTMTTNTMHVTTAHLYIWQDNHATPEQKTTSKECSCGGPFFIQNFYPQSYTYTITSTTKMSLWKD